VISGPVVVDASVVVEYLVELRLAAQATRLFRRLLDPDTEIELWAPDLIYPDVASALRGLVARRHLGAAAAEHAVRQLARLPIVATGTSALIHDAWRLRNRITVYDACYVTLARRIGAPLVTGDDHLVRTLAGRRDRVLALGAVES
jgi:predicted nucleic acid-binding protein